MVTFSQAQRDAVDAELKRRLQDRPELEWFFDEKRQEHFDIKNLELIDHGI